ncbi:glycoside hydrolase [Marinomonas sp. THO17]|uniref:glycoside hydrolase n=1 Tax=Marinomonas sp. THO17 TaxID=3149048 RepID=UPI00336BC4CA
MFALNFNRFSKVSSFIKGHQKHVTVSLISNTVMQEISPCYLSFSIDISVLAGGFWWDGGKGSQKGLGTEKTAPLDLNPSKLDLLVQALGPSYLRVGGSEADKLHYFTNPTQAQQGALQLTEETWQQLHLFCQRNDLKLMFTFKYGVFDKKQHGQWQADEVTDLLSYCRQQGQSIAICELGNELNAYWAFHGLSAQPSAKNLARDYDRFIKCIRTHSPNSLVAGPGSAFWPRIGEAIKPISNLTAPFLEHLNEKLDIVDWHYYPFQSSRSPVKTRAATPRNLLSPMAMLTFEKYAQQLASYRDKHQAHAEIWTGESGSAQCGGQTKLSDRFISSFWWADQLGRGAKLGQKVMIRQSLIGGDYALINRQTLKPNPDFWVSWLWQKLMGNQVYQVHSSDPSLLVYCHKAQKSGKCTLLMINMTAQTKIIHCQQFGLKKKRFEITADKLTAKKIRINGFRPKFKNGKVKLSDFPKLSKLNLISPYSINFWCFSL